MNFIEYPKISAPFKRDMEGTKLLIEGQYVSEILEYLKDNKWIWTEKIDGTNIGVVWDGHKVSFQGRTERANTPKFLLARLEEIFGGSDNEEVFEQLFGEKQFILFGEGYGAKIQQGGGNYIADGCDFILFDVYAVDSNLWLNRESIEGIAKAFNIKVVPIIREGTLEEAVEFVKSKPLSTIGNAYMEGVVCRPKVDVLDRQGKRVMTKVKVCDFK